MSGVTDSSDQSERNTGYEEVVVSDDGRERELRKTVDGEPPEIRGPQDYGYGTDLSVPAWDEVREELGDLDEYEDGEHVATIHYQYARIPVAVAHDNPLQ